MQAVGQLRIARALELGSGNEIQCYRIGGNDSITEEPPENFLYRVRPNFPARVIKHDAQEYR